MLREAKEVLVAKHSSNDDLYFLGRGQVVASGDLGLTFFSLSSKGSIFGEESVLNRQSTLTCTAQVRCELYSISKADLAKVAATLTPAGRDELAENILEEYFKHAIAINVALRLFATGISRALTREEVAAVRLQHLFSQRRIHRLTNDNAPPLDQLMRELYGNTAPPARAVPLAPANMQPQVASMPGGELIDLQSGAARLMRQRGRTSQTDAGDGLSKPADSLSTPARKGSAASDGVAA